MHRNIDLGNKDKTTLFFFYIPVSSQSLLLVQWRRVWFSYTVPGSVLQRSATALQHVQSVAVIKLVILVFAQWVTLTIDITEIIILVKLIYIKEGPMNYLLSPLVSFCTNNLGMRSAPLGRPSLTFPRRASFLLQSSLVFVSLSLFL